MKLQHHPSGYWYAVAPNGIHVCASGPHSRSHPYQPKYARVNAYWPVGVYHPTIGMDGKSLATVYGADWRRLSDLATEAVAQASSELHKLTQGQEDSP